MTVFGVLPLVARLVQAVLGGILLPWMAFRLTRRLFSDPTDMSQRAESGSGEGRQAGLSRAEVLGLLTAVLAAIYPYFVLYAATLMTETFYITALLWSLERALAVRERLMQGHQVGVGLAVTFGLSLGIAVLLRQSILPWVAVLFIWLLWIGWRTGQSRGVLKTLATAIVPMALLVLPFTIRNYHVYGSFLLLNSNAGYAMYSAQHPMHGTDFQEFAAAPLPDELAGLNEAQMDRELMRRGIGFVAADPRALSPAQPQPGARLLRFPARSCDQSRQCSWADVIFRDLRPVHAIRNLVGVARCEKKRAGASRRAST